MPERTPSLVTDAATTVAATGAASLWGLFGTRPEPVGFFVLLSAFALFAAIARSLASFEAFHPARFVGRLMTSVVAAWIVCFLAWSRLETTPPLLAALAVSSGLIGSEIAERLARYVIRRLGANNGP